MAQPMTKCPRCRRRALLFSQPVVAGGSMGQRVGFLCLGCICELGKVSAGPKQVTK